MYCKQSTKELAILKGYEHCTCSCGGYPDCICDKGLYTDVRLDDVQRWLREEHLMHICIDWLSDGTYEPAIVCDKFVQYEESGELYFNTYELALEASILDALTLIWNK